VVVQNGVIVFLVEVPPASVKIFPDPHKMSFRIDDPASEALKY
jgi:hypothetical protein